MKKPNFLIIGAARSGTTTLVHCLQQHPQVFFPPQLLTTGVEPKFFSREPEYEKGIAHYVHTYFSSADPYQVIGEKSTEYMESSLAAQRMYQLNPEMKLIALLRHPVERVISNYYWSVHHGKENRPINEAIMGEFEAYLSVPHAETKIFTTRPHAYIDRSLYYDNLLPFYQLFPVQQITCLLSDEFFDNPTRISTQVFSFLGVDEAKNISFQSLTRHHHAERIIPLDAALYHELEQFFSFRNEKLADLTGLDMSRWWSASC